MRDIQDVAYHESLSRKADNLANVAQYLHDQHPEKFEQIREKMQKRIPGVTEVDAKTTETGGILLRFQDGKFKNPFASKYVSDGTIKMFAYLVMLADPNPHKLLCVEEPENQLYPKLLTVLAEEFREYTHAGGQLFVSTHSPDFVNAVEIDELFIVKKHNGFSQIEAVAKNKIVASLYQEGDDKLGYLWQEGLL
jgi:predicted ATPase